MSLIRSRPFTCAVASAWSRAFWRAIVTSASCTSFPRTTAVPSHEALVIDFPPIAAQTCEMGTPDV